jgi:predicted enzyme related to lactoylglutathione lyase
MTHHRKSLLAAGIAAALLAGPALAQAPAPDPQGAPPKIDLPPVAGPTGQRLPGKVIWFDLLTLDPAAVRPFYSGVLGWTFEDRGEYAIARDGATPVAGILRMPTPKPGDVTPQSRWMPLVSVADVARAAASVQKAGGRVLEGPGSLGARGRYAAVSDPRGAQLVLVTAAGGDPADLDAPPPGWIWAELWTDDLKGSAAFYKAAVGYDTWQVGSGRSATWIYASGGRPRARAARMPFEKVPSQWLPYVVVKDLQVALARVSELGGHVLRKPGAKGPQFAVVSDPGGATFILEQRPEQVAEEVVQAPAAGAAAAGGATGIPPPPPEADPFGIGAAEQKSAAEAAAQAASGQQGAVAVPGGELGAEVVVVPSPAPYANVWIAPPAWGPFWGPGWGAPPGWVGAPWWGYPGAWGPGYAPPYYPGRPPYYGPGRPPYYPGYRPPPPPPRPGAAPGARPPGAAPRSSGSSPHSSAPAARPAPAPARAAPAAPRR